MKNQKDKPGLGDPPKVVNKIVLVKGGVIGDTKEIAFVLSNFSSVNPFIQLKNWRPTPHTPPWPPVSNPPGNNFTKQVMLIPCGIEYRGTLEISGIGTGTDSGNAYTVTVDINNGEYEIPDVSVDLRDNLLSWDPCAPS